MAKPILRKLPNSTRKFIRSEKARIRRQFLDYKTQKEAITNMYNKILNQPIVKKIEMPEPIKLGETSSKKPSFAGSYGRVKQEKPARNASHSDAGGEKTKAKNKKTKIHKKVKSKK
mgnify:CR=1 FL=1